MDLKKVKKTREILASEYRNLIETINRNRIAAESINIENTEDEGDLAAISHDRHLLYNLHEGDFARLRFIKQALDALERGEYGECSRCGDSINEKRLEAMPWATTCIRCQEELETERVSSNMVLAGKETEETEF